MTTKKATSSTKKASTAKPTAAKAPAPTARTLEAKEAASKATNADAVVKTGDAKGPDNNRRLSQLEAEQAASTASVTHADRRAGDTGVGEDATPAAKAADEARRDLSV